MSRRPGLSLLSAPLAAALAATILCLAASARAEVTSSGPAGFVVRNTVTVKGTQAAAYSRFLDIRTWWNPVHSYSQDSRNLTLKPVPGGCFCESLDQGGFVEHLRVVLVIPGKQLTLQGGLGPLLEMGGTGAMTVKFEAADAQTRVTLTYAVTASLPRAQAAEIGAAVDGVLLEQLQRYAKLANGG